MSAGRPGQRDAVLTGLQACLRQRLDGGGELVHLDDEVAEPGADLHRPVGRPVDQLEGDDLLAGELEHGQARSLGHANAPDLPVPERGVEVERDGQVSDPVRGVERLHRSAVNARDG